MGPPDTRRPTEPWGVLHFEAGQTTLKLPASVALLHLAVATAPPDFIRRFFDKCPDKIQELGEKGLSSWHYAAIRLVATQVEEVKLSHEKCAIAAEREELENYKKQDLSGHWEFRVPNQGLKELVEWDIEKRKAKLEEVGQELDDQKRFAEKCALGIQRLKLENHFEEEDPSTHWTVKLAKNDLKEFIDRDLEKREQNLKEAMQKLEEAKLSAHRVVDLLIEFRIELSKVNPDDFMDISQHFVEGGVPYDEAMKQLRISVGDRLAI